MRDESKISKNLASLKPPQRRYRWLLAACLFGLLSIGGYLNAPSRLLQSFAEQALYRHDPHAALVWLQRASRISTHDANLNLLSARAHLQLNLNTAAERDLEAIAVAPTNSPAQGSVLEAVRLMIAAQRGDQPASERLLDWQGEIALPQEAYEAIIRCCQLNNNLDRAAVILEKLEQAKDSPSMVAYQRGRILEIGEDWAGAAARYESSLAAQPQSARAAFRAGKCYAQLRNFEKAQVLFQQASSEPYVPIADTEVANCMWELNRFDEASAITQPILDIRPSILQSLYLQVDEFVDVDRAGIVAARVASSQGELRRAVELLERVLAYNHRDFEARTLLIKSLRLLERKADADALAAVQSQMIGNRQRCHALRLELEENPRNVEKLCELAELYWYTESVAESQLVLKRIFELDPNCARAQALSAKINAEQAGGDPAH